MAKKTTLKEFESVFPKLEAALLDQVKSYKLPQAEVDWYKVVSQYFQSEPFSRVLDADTVEGLEP